MNKKQSINPAVEAALGLDGNPETIKQYYAEWANSYDQDTQKAYPGPAVLVDFLLDVIDTLEDSRQFRNRTTKILDAGCGTGMVGKRLAMKNYFSIDGTDLSQEMIEKARELNVYRHLTSNIDLMAPISLEQQHYYDIVVCCGVFTLGHVPPEALHQLFRMTRPNGLVVASTRITYFDSTDYQTVTDDAITNKQASLIKAWKNAPYTDDGHAHYWAYRVLK